MGLSRIFKRLSGAVLLGAGALVMVGGCDTQSFFDPSEMGQYRNTAHVMPILKNLDTIYEEQDDRYANASDPRPSDLVATHLDYTIGRNDLLAVTIADIPVQGQENVKQTRVSESGYISLPLVGQVKAQGLTEAQLEQSVTQAYRDKNLLPNAQVSVTTIEARNRSFEIYGAVNQVGQYAILDSDFRLLDALVLARDVNSPVGIDYIYVVRDADNDYNENPEASPQESPATQPTPDMLTPHSQGPADPNSPKMMADDIAATAPATQPGEGHIVVVDDKPMQIGGQPTPTTADNAAAASADSAPATQPSNFEFNSLKEPSNKRIIRVPFDKLKNGELKYNIVIRPQDFIWVPQTTIGEYYVGGHVQRTGVYSLNARDITLRKAIIAAGMLDQLAVPERTEITRKISRYKVVYARVNLAKIFGGEEPDILLKPDDEIMVGTNALAPFLSAFRSGFRLTYGFGFIYDRNYNTHNQTNGG